MIEQLDKDMPLWKLTVGEYIELQKELNNPLLSKRYEYGLSGLAKILGCSKTRAYEIKKSGMLKSAIYQHNNIIIIDRDKVLELIQQSNNTL
ncbi:MAG: DUF3853 family protein [Bacteroidota bacterium]|nr:DUF3853 family protein [Bacteroidota bacterium]